MPQEGKGTGAMAKAAQSGAAAGAARAGAAKAAAGGAAPAAVGLRQMAAALAEDHGMPRRQVEAILNDFVTTFTDHLKAGTKVRVAGLGVFQVRDRPARTGRNPATGEQIEIPASRKIAFRPAKELKDSI